MKKIFLAFFFLFYFLCSYSKEIRAGKGEKIISIHSAIAAADSGDAIIVSDGIYTEGEILITKSISLRGSGKTIVDGQNKSQLFCVRASNVTIDGFIIKNTGMSDIREWAGIKIEDATNCIIKNNHVFNTFFAIYLANSSGCLITNNFISGNNKRETASGNGVHLWKCTNITVDGNQISGHRDGIYFEFAKNCFIRNNLSEKNLRYGLHFMFSDNDSYEKNIFRNNGSGVAVMYTKNVVMKNNRFEQNWGGAAYGLLLKEITHSEISNNIFIKNTTGIYAEGTSATFIHHNEFLNNGWALKIWGDCSDDTLTQNNFSGNTFDVATNATTSNNFFQNNYWDHYTGYDLNRDGWGDIPYHPVSLYSKMTEESSYSIMLLHSFFVDLLDRVEKMLPSVTPEDFKDDKPLMKPMVL